MSFLDYIQGKRKGKEAHRIELDAIRDPFLEEAIEGYDLIPANHLKNINRIKKNISAQSTSGKKRIWIPAIPVAAASCIILYFTFFNKKIENLNDSLYIYLPENHLERIQYAREINPTTEIQNLEILFSVQEIDIFVPEDYIEKKAVGNTDLTTPVKVTNLHEILQENSPIDIYIPTDYQGKHNINGINPVI